MCQAAMKTSLVLELLLSIFIFVETIDYINGCVAGKYYSKDILGCVLCPVGASCDDQHEADIARCKKACEKIDYINGCVTGEYYSEDIPGCVLCPGSCDDQYGPDIARCKKACETKATTTARPTLPPLNTEVPKHDQTELLTSTTNPRRPEIKSTSNNTTPTPEEADDPSANSEHLAISIAVLGTFIVLLIVVVIYFWHRSNISIVNEKSSDEERAEICGEPSTSSNEPSPVAKRSRSQLSSNNEEVECVPPVPETESGNLTSAVPEMESKLNLREEET